MYVALKVV